MPDEAVLDEWLVGRRWFASKARDVTEVRVLDTVPLAGELAVELVEARFHAGTHEIYQLLVAGEELDALADPETARALADLFGHDAVAGGDDGASVAFHLLEGVEIPDRSRAMGAEQSNSSIVFGERLVLKAFRRVEPGINPELEMLRFLTDHDFEPIPRLAGWYEYAGERMEATLGVLQRFVGGARDGWELALEELASDPEGLADRLRDLGAVTGRMHAVLGSDSTDPAFAPEEPSEELLSLLTATIDEGIERIFLDLPDGDEAVAPIAGRGEEVRDRLRLLSNVGAAGRMIRQHGDFHLGQTLWAPEGWVIIDFEGEPARPLVERRRKRSPLRDVAGMLRSFAYAASASEIQRGVRAPDGWEDRARERFLAGYFENVDRILLPPSEAATATLLSIYELEKAVYELGYEMNNRPEWIGIPVAGVARLLDQPLP